MSCTVQNRTKGCNTQQCMRLWYCSVPCLLAGGAGSSVAATNVLRALRQSRQAAALGLLEGQAQASLGTHDIEVPAQPQPPGLCLPHECTRQLPSGLAQVMAST